MGEISIKMSIGKVKKWRKTLYEDNGYPDNYTPPESFLAAIEKNKNLQVYSLWECFSGAAEVGKELSVVIIFWCCYKFLKTDLLLPETLLVIMLCLVMVGYLLFISLVGIVNLTGLLAGIKTTFLFTIIGFALSPVLYKLTDTISTDTIHTMAMSSLLIHLLTADYGLSAPIVSWQISLNAAVFSSVCLASRFDHHLSAFSLLSLSLQLPPCSSLPAYSPLSRAVQPHARICISVSPILHLHPTAMPITTIPGYCTDSLSYHVPQAAGGQADDTRTLG